MFAIGLAAEVGKVFVVSKTSASVVKAAAAEPHKFVVAKSGDSTDLTSKLTKMSVVLAHTLGMMNCGTVIAVLQGGEKFIICETVAGGVFRQTLARWP